VLSPGGSSTEYLGRNMSMLDENIKICIKETIFVFRLISSLKHGQSEIFGKGYEVICIENINILKNVAIGTF